MNCTFELNRGDAVEVISTLEVAELPLRRLSVDGRNPDTVRSYAREEADALVRIANELYRQLGEQSCAEEEHD